MRLRPLFLLTALLGTFACSPSPSSRLPDEGAMPELSPSATWLNSAPLTNAQLRGKVVLIDFWTYSCINCIRAIPYVKAWDAKYRSQGLVVIGVHAPEFDFEHDVENVKRAMTRLGITYPVILDNDQYLWKAFDNHYWPAHYFIDVHGRVRHHHFGEGGYEESEQVIRDLLADVPDSKKMPSSDTTRHVQGTGAEAASDFRNVKSPETYLGYARMERLTSPERVRRDSATAYTTPLTLTTNQWAFAGTWTVARQYSVTAAPHSALTFRFHARDLHLVLGTVAPGTPIKFRVTIDGHAPGADAGVDVDADGNGVITDHRMYQLIRQSGAGQERTFTITFDAPGAQVYAFTFG